ncbi:hypothetical protein [Gabonibacter chumensis]|uniref:hypothetical protein n=1 Tax=Gabonibacter chumensis TaxID=2972474 RepID=UPI0025731EEA|nr:hypothetical protein [Gabonibacter chumensis]MCR9013207.1 hypothetical protein [Gabonibacter chumensis]
MKKIIIILILFSYLTHKGFAQSKTCDFYERTYPNILNNCVENPVMSRLFTYNELPFRHSTGQVQIQIPVHELVINSLSLPIGVSYNSSGIRIQDNPGIIGYGWSMNCGFKISRSIRGKNDLEYPVIQNEVKNFCAATPLSGIYVKKLIKIAPEDSYNTPNAWENDKMDGQYDIFRIEIPNLNVSFLLEYTNGIYTARTFNASPLSIKLLTTSKVETRKTGPTTTLTRRYTDLYGIEVTDDNGICYKFGETTQRDARDQNKYTEYNKHSTRSGFLKTAWMLREICLSPTNKITFNYKDAIDYSDFQPKLITSVLYKNFLIQDPQAGSQNDLWILKGDLNAAIKDGNHIEYNMNLLWIQEKNRGIEDLQGTPEPNNYKLIKSITNPWIELEFNYDSIQKIGNPDQTVTSSYYRQRLSSIRVFSRSNNSRSDNIKDIHFYGHEGFLDSLSISGNGKYKFLYDRRDKNFTTEQFQKAIDWWGYCNGKNNASSLPRDDSHGSAADKRNPDSLYTKVKALEKIIYPTGGSVKINYGTHHFQDGTYGGGLRVESLETYDPSSGNIITKKFKYGKPRYSGIPYSSIDYHSNSTTHLYVGKDITIQYNGGMKQSYHAHAYDVDINTWTTFTFPLVYTPYTSFPVWYQNVTEENNEGKVEYTFEYTPYAYDPKYIDGMFDYTFSHEEPSLTKMHVFKKNGTGRFDPVKSVVNSYSRNFISLYEVNVVGYYREMSTFGEIQRRGSHEDLPLLDNSRYPSRIFRTLAIGQVSLKSTRETLYYQQDTTSTYTTFRYDKERPYNVILKTVLLKNRDLITQKYFYSNNQLPVNKGVTTIDHGLTGYNTQKTAVIQQQTSRNNKLVGSSLTYFKTVNSTQKVPKEKYYAGPDGVMEKREEFLSYDMYGNPVEIVKDKHASRVRLWSYGGMYPVAEIKNATFQQVKNVLSELAVTLPLQSLPDNIWSTLNRLRSTPDLKNASVTTYKYKPFVGLVEIVDSRGISTYFSYDAHGRLKETYIMENGSKKLLQENEYKFYDEK